jgi:phosphoglycolate phosphatase-like HAD superfamily hydrolase
MPGVNDVLAGLRPHVHASQCTLGLLTGNFAETGRLKLLACGIDPDQFTLNVWGDESPSSPPTRNDLPGVGLRRYHQRHGRALPGDRAVIIGDTPHDVACAKAHGCRSLAVATGKFTTAELAASGADLALDTLQDTQRVLRWLVP